MQPNGCYSLEVIPMEPEIETGPRNLPEKRDLLDHDFPKTSVPAKLRYTEKQLLDAIEKHDHEGQVGFLEEKLAEIDTVRQAIEREWGCVCTQPQSPIDIIEEPRANGDRYKVYRCPQCGSKLDEVKL